MELEMKRYAFISYNHSDAKMAKWLHRKLEAYRLPSEIRNEFEDSRYLRPVFRDKDDLNSGILSKELQMYLNSSKYLIVICSPSAARSQWVSDEVNAFIKSGRLEYIIPFIVKGTPNGEDAYECLPQSLRDYVAQHPDRELLAVSMLEVGRQKAFIRIISRMLGLSFDELWKRHERERRHRIAAWILGTSLVVPLLYWLTMPIKLVVTINGEGNRLPQPTDAELVVGTARYPLSTVDTTISVNSIPGYYRWRTIQISFTSTYYESVEQSIKLGGKVVQNYIIKARRDSTFATFAGIVFDEDSHPVDNATVTVGTTITVTDESGYFSVVFPVSEQSTTKHVRIVKENSSLTPVDREEEWPGSNLRYVMHKTTH